LLAINPEMQVRLSETEASAQNLETAQVFEKLGVQVQFGHSQGKLVEWADLVVPCPGVPPANPLLAAAKQRGVPIWSELELGWRVARGPVVAITGTNGKTTTTTLLAEILNVGGVPAVAAGNIGLPLAEAALNAEAGTVFVVEVSSFQLAFIDQFRPAIGVVLNVADDHLDWHPNRLHYVRAKGRITQNQTEADALIVNEADEGAMAIAAGTQASLLCFAPGSPEETRVRAERRLGRPVGKVAGSVGGMIVLGSQGLNIDLIEFGDIRLVGLHNLQNVFASALAADRLSLHSAVIAKAIGGFEGLPHRMCLIGDRKGVRFINDSKATNPAATLAALQGMERVVLIAGGRAKGLDLSVLRTVRDVVKRVIVMGEAAPDLEEVFQGRPVDRAADVEDAVRKAVLAAKGGDTVLLSPACSSLDQYSGYTERGDRVAKAVNSL